MKKFYYILLLPILLVFLVGCSNEKKKAEPTLVLQESFNGKWQLQTKSSEPSKRFIEFNGDQLSMNLSDKETDSMKGNWTFNLSDSVLRFTPKTELVAKLDSTMIEFDSTGQVIKYYSGGQHIASKTNTDLVQEIGVITFKAHLSGRNLVLQGDDKTYTFAQPTLLKETPELSFSLESILRGILGLAFLIGISWLFSANRKKIDWPLIIKGMVLQGIIAILVLKVPAIAVGFNYLSEGFVWIIGKTDSGVNFLFGQFGIGTVQAPLLTFAIKVLPTIIFFSALVSLFYYWGVLQKIVFVFAWVMKKFMRLSGAESLAAAGNVFLGQTEAPLLVKPYLLGMTKSEIMCLMTGGMATIAGGVLAAYVNFLGGDDPVQQAFFAKHLLTASIISAPAAIVAAKILVPETEPINEDLKISKEKIGTNALEAISNGTTDGLKLAVNVGAMLLVFIALMALANGLLDKIGGWTGINSMIAQGGIYSGLSFEFMLGYIGRPIVWLMGVDWADSIYVGELLGTKTVLNEFVAYPRLGEMKEAGMLSEKSVIMSTYMLCGFANFASIGIQIGGIGALIPSRKGLLSKLGVQALIGGTVACLMTAVIVGMTM